MSAIDLVIARVTDQQSPSFEGMREDVYDDATGDPIECAGQPTIGYGCRCRQWSPELAETVLRFELGEFEAPLLQQSWYRQANEARQSALLEVAFNQGDAGLERGYPRLIAAVSDDNWVQSGVECTVKNPRLQRRYAGLAKILVTGESA